VTGNYYTKRPTFMDEINWDLALSLKMPLYQGGAVTAKVREAESAWRQARLTLEEMERDVAYNVRRLHGELSAAVEETRSLEEAAQAAQKSYDALRQEYKLGLVTNLDVLQALDQLQTQQSARDEARLKAKRLSLELNVAMEKPL
jgi:outer membrane protein